MRKILLKQIFIITFCIAGNSLATSLDSRIFTLEQTVNSAHKKLSDIKKQVDNGLLLDKTAKLKAKKLLSEIRVNVGGDDSYLFVFDTNLKMVVHPIKPIFEGRDFSGVKDPTGKPIFAHFLAAISQGGIGKSNYVWSMPGCDTPRKKIAVLLKFEPWSWIIGTSLYEDEVCK